MLIIGPPGSGKTHDCLERLDAAVRQRRTRQVHLVTPTAGMAQRLLHRIARRGLTVPGDLVLSRDELVAKLVPDSKTPSAAEADWFLRLAIEQAAGSEEFFGRLCGADGIRRRVARSIADLQEIRCDPRKFQSLAQDKAAHVLAGIYKLYESFLRSYGFVSPAERLTLAAQEAAMSGCLGIEQIDFDGFERLSAGERDLMQSLASCGVTVRITLPRQPGPGSLPRMQRGELQTVRRHTPAPAIVRAADMPEEVEEIARSILAEHHRSNAPFRDFAVILRSPESYADTIQAVFEAMRIPYRLRRRRTLAQHRVGRFALHLLRAVRDGFPADGTLDALRMTPSVAASADGADRWGFRVRELLPAVGLDVLRADAPAKTLEAIGSLESAAGWAAQRAEADEWRRRCQQLLAGMIAYPDASDGLSPARVLELRTFASAVAALAEALAETEKLLSLGGGQKLPFSRFLSAFEGVVELTPLSIPDARRDVVEVISAEEARQWELPHVFVAGLVEGWFPKAEPDDLLLPDASRRRLRAVGLDLRTLADAETEERTLLETAKARATRSLTLSYPLADRAGSPLLRSFLLESDPAQDRPASGAKAVRPPATLAKPVATIDDPRLRHWIAGRDKAFSPSGLDRYLQCPYLAFAERTLPLEDAPKRPEERIDNRWKGSVMHQVVAEWGASGDGEIGEILDRIFDSALAEQHLPGDFTTALLKSVMRRDLETFAEHPAARSWGERGALEQNMRFVADAVDGSEFAVTGRIDRYDLIDGEAVLVIDYKNSSAPAIRRTAARHETGHAVQLLLYLSGLARRDRRPAGALLWSLRGEPSLAGWLEESLYERVEAGKSVKRLTQAALQGLIRQAEATAAQAVGEIRSGRIEAAPIDTEHCKRSCGFRDLCRIEL